MKWSIRYNKHIAKIHNVLSFLCFFFFLWVSFNALLCVLTRDSPCFGSLLLYLYTAFSFFLLTCFALLTDGAKICLAFSSTYRVSIGHRDTFIKNHKIKHMVLNTENTSEQFKLWCRDDFSIYCNNLIKKCFRSSQRWGCNTIFFLVKPYQIEFHLQCVNTSHSLILFCWLVADWV